MGSLWSLTVLPGHEIILAVSACTYNSSYWTSLIMRGVFVANRIMKLKRFTRRPHEVEEVWLLTPRTHVMSTEKTPSDLDLRKKHTSFRARATRWDYEYNVHMDSFSGILNQDVPACKLFWVDPGCLGRTVGPKQNFRCFRFFKSEYFELLSLLASMSPVCQVCTTQQHRCPELSFWMFGSTEHLVVIFVSEYILNLKVRQWS